MFITIRYTNFTNLTTTMKKLFISLAIILSIIIPLSASKAFDVKVDNSIHLNKEEIADGNVYASCSDMTIDGSVNGDVIAICKNIVINGVINGDLIAFSNNVTINGEVKGSARIAGTNLNVNGTIGHNINAFGTEINLSPNSIVNWDVLVAGVNGVFAGNINGNLHGYISTATVSGKIGKNIDFRIDSERTEPGQGGLLITKDAVIGGGLTYSAKQEAKIESPSSIVGSTTKLAVKDKTEDKIAFVSRMFYKLSALILIGLVLISLKKKETYKIVNNLETKWWQSALIGLATLIATPIIVLFFCMTLIGVPLALILLVTYLTFISLAIILSSFFIGDLILKKIFKKTVNAFASLILGLAVFILFASLPYLGGSLVFLSIIWGLGGLLLTIKQTQHD